MLVRLAIHKSYQVSGMGFKTLGYALRHAAKLSSSGFPGNALVLDVLDEQTLSFCQKFEMFESFADDPMRLFVLMKALEKLNC
jgi:hypothetical protein